MRKLKILALTLSAMTLSSAASAAGWAACQNPNPPFFCTQPEQPIQGPQGDQGPKGERGPRGYAGADGKNGINGRNGRDFNATQYRAALASSAARGGLHFRELKAGQVGGAAGIGGQLRGDAALAIGINFGLTDNISANVSISRSFRGGETSAFIGVSGRF